MVPFAMVEGFLLEGGASVGPLDPTSSGLEYPVLHSSQSGTEGSGSPYVKKVLFA